jgi:hypothetical protein
MTVAYDTSTVVGETTGDKSDWSHTAGAANIKGALVYIVIRNSNTPPVGVTYGGVAMTKITEANDTNAEIGNTTAWFLTNPGNGTKTIAVDVGAAQVWGGIAITCTGAANLTTRVGTPVEANADDPSIVIDNPAAWVNYPSGAIFSGQTDPASTTAGTGFTVLGGVDFTGGGVSDTAQFERYTTGTVTGDPTVAFTTAATDDVAMVAVSMGEVTVNTQSVPATTTHTVTLGKRYLKAIAAAATFTVALIRRVSKKVAATATLTAAIARRVGKKVSLTATLTAVLDAVFDAGGTVYNQAVAAATTLGAAIVKWLEEPGAKIVRQVNKPRPVGITFTVALARRVGKLIAAAISFTTALVASFIAGGQTFLQAVNAATTFTVALVRRVGKPSQPPRPSPCRWCVVSPRP